MSPNRIASFVLHILKCAKSCFNVYSGDSQALLPSLLFVFRASDLHELWPFGQRFSLLHDFARIFGPQSKNLLSHLPAGLAFGKLYPCLTSIYYGPYSTSWVRFGTRLIKVARLNGPGLRNRKRLNFGNFGKMTFIQLELVGKNPVK